VTETETRLVPEGWAPLGGGSPFVRHFGPLYVKEGGGERLIGMRVEEKHLNTRGIAHGGMLVTLADTALGVVLSQSEKPPRPMVTVSLSVDFAAAARLGDWVEAHVDVQRSGRQLAFASCHLVVDGKRILRASGVFAVVAPAGKREDFEG
jgi:acyl-coenzyme A thioesterase 13